MKQAHPAIELHQQVHVACGSGFVADDGAKERQRLDAKPRSQFGAVFGQQSADVAALHGNLAWHTRKKDDSSTARNSLPAQVRLSGLEPETYGLKVRCSTD